MDNFVPVTGIDCDQIQAKRGSMAQYVAEQAVQWLKHLRTGLRSEVVGMMNPF